MWYLDSVDVDYAFVEVYQSLFLPSLLYRCSFQLLVHRRDTGSDCTDQLQSGQLYVGPFQLHPFDIGGKGLIQMIRIQGLGV